MKHAVMKRHDDAVVTSATSKVHVALEVLAEPVELALRDVQRLLENGPLYSLRAGWSREGALIGPVSISFKIGSQVLNVDSGLPIFKLVSSVKCREDLFKELVILVWVHSFQEHSKDSDFSAIQSIPCILATEMHNMELCSMKLAFNSML